MELEQQQTMLSEPRDQLNKSLEALSEKMQKELEYRKLELLEVWDTR